MAEELEKLVSELFELGSPVQIKLAKSDGKSLVTVSCSDILVIEGGEIGEVGTLLAKACSQTKLKLLAKKHLVNIDGATKVGDLTKLIIDQKLRRRKQIEGKIEEFEATSNMVDMEGLKKLNKIVELFRKEIVRLDLDLDSLDPDNVFRNN